MLSCFFNKFRFYIMDKKVQFLLVGVIFLLMLFYGSIEAAPVGLNKVESLEERLEKLEKREKDRYKDGEKEIRVYFKNGFKMRSLDNNFKFQAGGRIMHDWGFFTYEEIQNVEFPNL